MNNSIKENKEKKGFLFSLGAGIIAAIVSTLIFISSDFFIKKITQDENTQFILKIGIIFIVLIICIIILKKYISHNFRSVVIVFFISYYFLLNIILVINNMDLIHYVIHANGFLILMIVYIHQINLIKSNKILKKQIKDLEQNQKTISIIINELEELNNV